MTILTFSERRKPSFIVSSIIKSVSFFIAFSICLASSASETAIKTDNLEINPELSTNFSPHVKNK